MLVQYADDVRRHQSVLCHHVGLEPDAHGVVVAHHADLAHAGDALDLGHDVDGQVVAQKLGVVGIRWVVEGHDFELAVLPFLGGYANLGHFGGQGGLGFRDTVLHIDRGHVGIRPLLEIDVDGGGARVGGGGGHVEHVFHAVDFLFQGHDDALQHRLGTGSGVGGRYLYGGWGDVGVLLHREVHQADDA